LVGEEGTCSIIVDFVIELLHGGIVFTVFTGLEIIGLADGEGSEIFAGVSHFVFTYGPTMDSKASRTVLTILTPILTP
jgi:hypothetical protein